MNCLKCNLLLDIRAAHYGLHEDCFASWFKVPSHAEFISLTRKSSASTRSNAEISKNSSFFQGKFKKYSATLGNDSYILKMRQEEAPELPEVEYLCNQIAEVVGVPVAEFFYIDFFGDKVFVTRNFIKQGMPTDLQHLYLFRPDDQHSCEGIIRAIINNTHKPHDLDILIKTILFDALIGNHDRHGKNLAFIVTSKEVSLSPIFDNVSYLSLEKGTMLKADFNPAGKISTQNTYEPSMSDYVKELDRLGYREQVIDFHRKVSVNKLHQLIQKSFCTELMKQALTKLINKRYKELNDELNN